MELIKAGSGTLVLSGSNTYSGGTYVTDGKLIVAASDALLDGSNLFVGANAVFSFGTVLPANVSAAGRLLPSGAVPEPATLALLAAAVCGAAVCDRRRLRRKKQ